MRIAIVAGEPSGDILAAGLMREIKQIHADASFYGIGGENMQAEGFEAHYPMDAIALMGVESVLKDIRNILNIRKTIGQAVIDDKPDCFIGVDVPDFNFSLELRLRESGIKVIHYVSPSVWAWRGYRIKKIKRAVDHVLTLFPFESVYYEKHDIPATFIGHPTASKSKQIESTTDTSQRDRTIALLPGSRRAEVKSLLPIMLQAAKLLWQRYPDTRFVLPFANSSLLEKYRSMVLDSGLPIEMTLKNSGAALSRSKLSIVASGTAALEALIYGSVMVVVYKVALLSYLLFSALKHVEHFSLPNQLLAAPEVPELSQNDVTPDNILEAAASFLDHPETCTRLQAEFADITESLNKQTDQLAAKAVLAELKMKGV